jgi:hypothetical protein
MTSQGLIPLRKIIPGLERTRKFFFVLKSVPTQSSQDKEKFSCPFQSRDNFPEWKLAFMVVIALENRTIKNGQYRNFPGR